jgi:hypothetical protein
LLILRLHSQIRGTSSPFHRCIGVGRARIDTQVRRCFLRNRSVPT